MSILLENNKLISSKRVSKKIRYAKEQLEIFNELYKKIELFKKENSIMIYDIINNDEIINTLKKLIPLIKCYYSSSNWSYFINNNLININLDEKCIRSLIKSIFKYHNYDIIQSLKTAERNGIKKQYVFLTFFKK